MNNYYFCSSKRSKMDTLADIRRPIQAELERYKFLFDSTLTHEDDFLGQALAYLRGRKGKLMRPILVLLVAKEAGEVHESSLRAAVTLELLHTASLVHDDVVDESAQRRGQASVNSVYDNKVAVLVGDYLLSQSLHQAALSDDIRIVDIIARLGGTLASGEIFQLENVRRPDFTERAYFHIIRHKTAALFAACAQLGALSAGASEVFTDLARQFGEIVGICFQIRDDIFDYSDSKELGKPTGNDMLEGKLTLPAIYALKKHGTPEMLAIAARVKEGTASADDIAALVAFTKEKGGIAYAERVMDEHRQAALKLLAGFRNTEVRRSLELYLDFVIGRTM